MYQIPVFEGPGDGKVMQSEHYPNPYVQIAIVGKEGWRTIIYHLKTICRNWPHGRDERWVYLPEGIKDTPELCERVMNWRPRNV